MEESDQCLDDHLCIVEHAVSNELDMACLSPFLYSSKKEIN